MRKEQLFPDCRGDGEAGKNHGEKRHGFSCQVSQGEASLPPCRHGHWCPSLLPDLSHYPSLRRHRATAHRGFIAAAIMLSKTVRRKRRGAHTKVHAPRSEEHTSELQ